MPRFTLQNFFSRLQTSADSINIICDVFSPSVALNLTASPTSHPHSYSHLQTILHHRPAKRLRQLRPPHRPLHLLPRAQTSIAAAVADHASVKVAGGGGDEFLGEQTAGQGGGSVYKSILHVGAASLGWGGEEVMCVEVST